MSTQLNLELNNLRKIIEQSPKNKALLFAYLNGDEITTEYTTDEESMANLFYNLFTHHPQLLGPALKASQVVIGVKNKG